MNNVIIKFALVLETTEDEDHGVKFVGIFRALLRLLHSQDIDFSYAGVNQCDLQSIHASVKCKG